jgi:hypothetical protein
MSRSEDQEYATISLPRSLIEKIEARIKGTGFASPDAYVAYVLGEIIAEDRDEEPGLSPEEEERIKEKLHALGYLG